MFELYYDGVDLLLPKEQFHPFARIADRASWRRLTPDTKQFLVSHGEAYLHYTWPTLLASSYMEFFRNGNRSRFEHTVFTGRRLPLQYLVMAECVENRGRFLDDIINGLWSTLDEATWVIPACNPQYKANGARPLFDTVDPDKQYVELFSAECAAVLSWAYYLLQSRLDVCAPQIGPRILYELQNRIITPFMEKEDYFWMGFDGGKVNNWNPWICENLMTVAVLAVQQPQLRSKMMGKCFRCLENFVKGYYPDGGCDEGPNYWNAAGAALFDCMEIAFDATGGKVNFFKEPLLRNICTYIYKMQIADDCFVNFADASAKVVPNAGVIYRMGKRLHEPNLRQMGIALHTVLGAQSDSRAMNGTVCQIYRYTRSLFQYKELCAKAPCSFPYPKNAWFPGIEVVCAREEKGSTAGLFLCAKGGNNGESHNHNDVGNFVVYANGLPAIVDIGTGVYEKKTFSPQRYEILQMQSQYHNVPTVAAVQQQDGIGFSAAEALCMQGVKKTAFSLQLAGAYPETAHIQSWKRSFVFDRALHRIALKDSFAFTKPQTVAFTLMTAVKPILEKNTLVLKLSAQTTLCVAVDPRLTVKIEPFDTQSDENLNRCWGKTLYRVLLSNPAETQKDTCCMNFYLA